MNHGIYVGRDVHLHSITAAILDGKEEKCLTKSSVKS